MASKRKSSTPCMVLLSETVEQDPEMEMITEGEEGVGSMATAPVEGAVVPAESEPGGDENNLGPHSEEDSLIRTKAKRNSHTVLGQTANDLSLDSSFGLQPESEEGEDTTVTGISFSKTPIMKMRSRAEPKRIALSHKVSDEGDVRAESEGEQERKEAHSGTLDMVTPFPVDPGKPCVIISNQGQILTEPKKTIINSATVLPAGLAQVLSALQAQQNSHTQLLIPVSSIPTYNGAMDNNAMLVNTYNKFPYPSVSEIMGLAAQTKFTEEQIKIWFSAQRLKHGVSWTPEEVEEARRKQFNGTVHTVSQTITVIPAHLSAAANGLQSILQTCQIVGQPGLVLTQVGGANTLPVTTPITLTVAGVPNQAQPPKPATIQTAPAAVEVKRATTVQPPVLTPQENSALSADHLSMRTKKSKEQLAELKASYLKNHFASDAEIARLMKLTNLTKGEIKKWFSDTRYNQRNSKNCHVPIFNDSAPNDSAPNSSATIVIDSSDETMESSTSVPVKETRNKGSRNPFPDFTLQKFKEKTPEQLLLLEDSYQKCSTPTDEELSRLRTETKLTRREVDAWFTERRKAPETEQREVEAAKAISSTRHGRQTSPSSRRQARDKIGKKTPEQLHILKGAFVRTQWPSAEEYDKLAEESGLPRPYIVNWFGDTRYAWKNGNLKWYYFYQSGNAGAVNGGGYRKRGKGRARNRGRGWSRRSKRSSSWGRSPPVKSKSGKEILKEYYLKHKFLNEQDLDELVSKSNMSYEQVRDWFAEVGKRVEMGVDPFEGNLEEEQQQHGEGNGKTAAKRRADGAGQEEDGETDDSDAWEPSKSARKPFSGSED